MRPLLLLLDHLRILYRSLSAQEVLTSAPSNLLVLAPLVLRMRLPKRAGSQQREESRMTLIEV